MVCLTEFLFVVFDDASHSTITSSRLGNKITWFVSPVFLARGVIRVSFVICRYAVSNRSPSVAPWACAWTVRMDGRPISSFNCLRNTALIVTWPSTLPRPTEVTLSELLSRPNSPVVATLLQDAGFIPTSLSLKPRSVLEELWMKALQTFWRVEIVFY